MLTLSRPQAELHDERNRWAEREQAIRTEERQRVIMDMQRLFNEACKQDGPIFAWDFAYAAFRAYPRHDLNTGALTPLASPEAPR